MQKLLCLFALGCSLAGATPISYTIAGSGSGGIYTPGTENRSAPLSTFANQPFTLNLFSDTSLIQASSGGIYVVPAAQGDVTLGTVSSVPTFSAWIFEAPDFASLYFGLLESSINAVMNMEAAAFSSYDLSTTIGPFPVSAQANPEQRFNAVIPSALGDIQFTALAGVTFAADPPTVTPEPVSFALLGLGMAGLGMWKRRQLAH
jgi:hypothetical protein